VGVDLVGDREIAERGRVNERLRFLQNPSVRSAASSRIASTSRHGPVTPTVVWDQAVVFHERRVVDHFGTQDRGVGHVTSSFLGVRRWVTWVRIWVTGRHVAILTTSPTRNLA
jgi:hypothetical protein